eukprot:scaffold155_cov347-Pavlova_lutheri.AAC.50
MSTIQKTEDFDLIGKGHQTLKLRTVAFVPIKANAVICKQAQVAKLMKGILWFVLHHLFSTVIVFPNENPS